MLWQMGRSYQRDRDFRSCSSNSKSSKYFHLNGYSTIRNPHVPILSGHLLRAIIRANESRRMNQHNGKDEPRGRSESVRTEVGRNKVRFDSG
jgi:hypothetical protein